MKTTHLGRTGLNVSRICLGTMNFGPYTTPEDSFAIMDRALEAGIQFFDTANVYGRQAGKGTTEKIVGEWFAQGNGRRDQVVLATKVYGTMGDGPNDRRLSARHIRRACEDSLQRLQTDHIDLYQMHHVDRETPWEEIWQAMEQLIREGKILYVGSSNFAAWHIVKANAAAQQRGLLGIVSEQSIYHLDNRTVELEVLPMCASEGVGVLPWSPLGGGLLGGALKKQAAGGRRATDFVQSRVDKIRPQLEAYEKLCDKIGVPAAEVALAWVMRHPAVTAPIIGPRTMEHLESAIRAAEVNLGEDTANKLDEIFPGPGGAAPEAYAW
jgi:aryl-alcohol dehydrogenase-like predicted oxidoreductase